MADRHRFILTTPVLPWPADQGSKYFQLEVARGLLSVGPVCWVTREIGDQSGAIRKLKDEGFELRLDTAFRDRSPLTRMRRRIGIDLRAWREGTSRDESFVCTPEVRHLVTRVREASPGAIGVAAFWSATPVLSQFPEGRRVYVVSDVDSMREARGRNRDRAAGRIAEAERRALGRVDLALTLSAEDHEDALALLEGAAAPQFGRCPVSIQIPDQPLPASDGGELLLYGHWEAPFNRDGLRWFLREIWPVLREHPSAPRLRIVGKGDPESLDDSRATWVGFVEDLETEFGRARAVLIPLRYASGLRYRLLESFAHARCVLATEVAARGSGAVAGQHYLEVSEAGSWSKALDHLDPSLALDAFNWVNKNHSRAGLTERWTHALAPVLSRRSES